jgi:uroporphyrinogen decarboxylase
VVIAVFERKAKKAPVPMVMHKWWGNGLVDKYGAPLNEMAAQYPDDIHSVFYLEPGFGFSTNTNPSYRWGYKDYSSAEKHSIGAHVVLLTDWAEMDRFLADFPDPNEPGNFERVENSLPDAGARYKLGGFWRLFHERFWGIRGMENLMMDYYDNIEGLKILGKRLIQYYKVIVDRYAALGFDGIFSSDDLGHQQGPMMSPAVFKELYLPLYAEIISHIHNKGMHFFLHSCGDNTLLLPYLIEAGVDVFHPVQKGCMDPAKTAAAFGDKISFLAGADVQHLLPEETAANVAKGIREWLDFFYKPEGGLLLAAGNGIMPDTPLENIEAMLRTGAMYRGAGNKQRS